MRRKHIVLLLLWQMLPLVLYGNGYRDVWNKETVTTEKGLPVVYIDTDGMTIGREERADATISWQEISDSTCTFILKAGVKVRGASTAGYPKKSYSVEFRDSVGEEVDIQMFGLRNDGDWILDAMYIDPARMRNRLCTDIWNAYNRIPHLEKEPDALNGTRGLFVEVVLNGEYNGLYCLTERVDRKQLKLKKYKNGYRGVSFKSVSWDNLMGYCSYNPDLGQETLLWNGFESEYPGEVEYAGWIYLQEFLEFLSPKYTSDEYFATEVESHIYLDNLVDYILLINAVYAIDNVVKNLYLNIYNVQESRRVFFTPWDLDATFGRTYDGSAINLYAFYGSVPFGNVLVTRLWNDNVCGFREMMEMRWKELRTTALSVDSVAARIRGYQELFEESGAYERERQLWPQKCKDIVEEADFMIDWYTRNVEVMDSVLLQATEVEDVVCKHLVWVENDMLAINVLEASVAVYNTKGHLIWQIADTSGIHYFPLPDKGVYMVRVTDMNQVLEYKVCRVR